VRKTGDLTLVTGDVDTFLCEAVARTGRKQRRVEVTL
jgi:hypothetical protein